MLWGCVKEGGTLGSPRLGEGCRVLGINPSCSLSKGIHPPAWADPGPRGQAMGREHPPCCQEMLGTWYPRPEMWSSSPKPLPQMGRGLCSAHVGPRGSETCPQPWPHQVPPSLPPSQGHLGAGQVVGVRGDASDGLAQDDAVGKHISLRREGSHGGVLRCVPASVSPPCMAAPGPSPLGTPGMPVPIPPCPSACPAGPRAANPEDGPTRHHLLVVDLPSQHLGRHPVRGAHHGQRLLLAALAVGGHSRTSGALSPCPSPPKPPSPFLRQPSSMHPVTHLSTRPPALHHHTLLHPQIQPHASPTPPPLPFQLDPKIPPFPASWIPLLRRRGRADGRAPRTCRWGSSPPSRSLPPQPCSRRPRSAPGSSGGHRGGPVTPRAPPRGTGRRGQRAGPYLGGEVAVEDALGVQVAQPPGDVEGQLDARGPGEGHGAVQQLLQVAAVDVLMGQTPPRCTPPLHPLRLGLLPPRGTATPGRQGSVPVDIFTPSPRNHPGLVATIPLSPPSARAAAPGARTPP